MDEEDTEINEDGIIYISDTDRIIPPDINTHIAFDSNNEESDHEEVGAQVVDEEAGHETTWGGPVYRFFY